MSSGSRADALAAIYAIAQRDIGNRGLAHDPASNLFNAHPNDFANACVQIGQSATPHLGIVTGFYIPNATPPAAETDGPLGAIYLARTLIPLGIRVTILVDEFLVDTIRVGLIAAGLDTSVAQSLARLPSDLTHLIALERVGPSYSAETISDVMRQTFIETVAAEHWDRCLTMRGRDITDIMEPAHCLFENSGIPTIGIGDGGNEIGMGKISWDTIRRNIPNGATIACRVKTDHLIVVGISNWGAYALAAGIAVVRGQALHPLAYDLDHERTILQAMIDSGPLVDGVTGKPTLSVDGFAFDEYIQPLIQIGRYTTHDRGE